MCSHLRQLCLHSQPVQATSKPGGVHQDIAPSPEGKNVSMGAFVRDVFLEQVTPCRQAYACRCPPATCCTLCILHVGRSVCLLITAWSAALRARAV